VLLDIAGLQYIPTYLDGATHDRLLAAVDEQPWLRSADRGVQVYGYSYHRASDTAFPVGPLPAWATDLAARLCHDGLMPSVPDQLVVNDYPEGAGIFSHVDQSVFGATIASVSLGSTCVMQFVHVESARQEELLLEPRSVLLLSGEARWQWKHGIPARAVDTWQNCAMPRSRRVSLTFRSMPPQPECS
jgi:alkylated DNA repair dioxygenase AlkB